MTLHILNALKGLTIVDVVSSTTETKFYIMSSGDVKFSDLHIIKEQLNDIKEIIIHTYESEKSPNGEEYQMQIIVENKEKIESAYLPGNPDSVTTHKRCVQ